MAPIGRRGFVIASVGSVLTLATRYAGAQSPKRMYRVAFPAVGPRSAVAPLVEALEQGLKDHGYAIGRDVVVDFRSADGSLERLPGLMQEFVRAEVDVIVTSVNPVIAAAQSATQTIPIVMAIGTDVVTAGFVKSLAHPGGNITGITWDVGGNTAAKALELLRDIASTIKRVAVLWEPPYEANYRRSIEGAAAGLGLRTYWLEHSGDLKRDFAELLRVGADALYALTGARVYMRRAEIVALAAQHRLPATYVVSEFVDAGGLMSYSPTNTGAFRAAARYVHKILQGARAADLPVEQPSKIDLSINLRAAKAIGLSIPSSMLLRADRVIK